MNPYQVLGVSSEQDLDEIKKAYRKLCKMCHPDIDNTDGAGERFQQIQEAFAYIKQNHERLRKQYQEEYAKQQDAYANVFGNARAGYNSRFTPEEAYRYALDVDCGARDDTRAAACQDPEYAYLYAKNIDRCARDDTRRAACQDSMAALYYARDVDRGPHDDTRVGACQDPRTAYRYAFGVDQCPRDDTRSAAYQAPYWKKAYTEWEEAYNAGNRENQNDSVWEANWGNKVVFTDLSSKLKTWMNQ